jgi:hypothetical protein
MKTARALKNRFNDLRSHMVMGVGALFMPFMMSLPSSAFSQYASAEVGDKTEVVERNPYNEAPVPGNYKKAMRASMDLENPRVGVHLYIDPDSGFTPEQIQDWIRPGFEELDMKFQVSFEYAPGGDFALEFYPADGKNLLGGDVNKELFSRSFFENNYPSIMHRIDDMYEAHLKKLAISYPNHNR